MACELFPNVVNFIKGKKDSRENVPVSSVFGQGKVVAIYFSAHWCPPCRGFTPKLCKWYTELKKELNDKFEIIFVSSDKDQGSFDGYFDEMPWLALSYDERDLKAKLSAKHKVKGIPTLLMFDGNTGELTNKNGRSVVDNDPSGKEFPWKEATLTEMLSTAEFVNKDGDKKPFSYFQGKPLCLYFSAHWCPPCRGFTPKLAEFYEKNAKDKFELIFVSGDRSEDDFKGYLKEMPWYALTYDNKKLNEKLNEEFEVSGIPHLVVLNESFKIINDNGRSMVEKDPEAKDFPWYPKPLNALGGDTAGYINDRPCLVCVTDGTEDQVKEIKEKMRPTAEKYFAKNKENRESVAFLYTEGDDLDSRLLDFINIKGPFPKMILVNIPAGKKYICECDKIDEAAVEKFLNDFESGACTGMGLRD